MTSKNIQETLYRRRRRRTQEHQFISPRTCLASSTPSRMHLIRACPFCTRPGYPTRPFSGADESRSVQTSPVVHAMPPSSPALRRLHLVRPPSAPCPMSTRSPWPPAVHPFPSPCIPAMLHAVALIHMPWDPLACPSPSDMPHASPNVPPCPCAESMTQQPTRALPCYPSSTPSLACPAEVHACPTWRTGPFPTWPRFNRRNAPQFMRPAPFFVHPWPFSCAHPFSCASYPSDTLFMRLGPPLPPSSICLASAVRPHQHHLD